MNARTCKHLKTLLGDKYEIARIKMKNPDGPQPKATTSKTRAASKVNKSAPAKSAKAAGKRKKPVDDDDAEYDEDKAHARPSKRAKSAATSSRPQSKGKAKQVEEEEEEEEEDAEEAPSAAKSVPELLLANKWDIETGPDPTGWWMSEKLDGVRCGSSRQIPGY